MSNFEKGKIIVTDSSGFITSDVLNKYEVTAILSKRAEEIENGAEFEENLLEEVTDPKFTSIQLAEAELSEGLIPYYIYRKIGPNAYEKRFVPDMYYLED
jgi:DNA-directed RNA polymerase subunit K/omega